MKVGIVTFQRVNNYGAVLQSFALQKVIRELGVECETIDYVRNNFGDVLKWQKNKIKSYLSGKPDKQLYTNLEFIKMTVLEVLFNQLSASKFDKFRNNIQYSAKVNKQTISKLEEDYDLFITGSDQVWNPGRVNLDATYLLDFVKDDRKKGSYAASFGIKEIPEKYLEKYKQCLRDYRYYSCREADGVRLLKELVDQEGKVVLDPTMLLSGCEWKKYIKKCDVGEPYILVYQLGTSDTLMRYAKIIAEKKKLKIIVLPYPRIGKNVKWLSGVGPQEWLGVIEGAEYVVTNSFHGAVFSLLFERKVYIEVTKQRVRAAMGSRIENLIKLFSLEERIIEDDSFNDLNINYTEINKKLEKYKSESIEYLKKMLKV